MLKKPLFTIASLFLLVISSPATIYPVTVNGSSFSPATLQIEVGDTVIWENTDDIFSHTATSDLALFDPNYWNGILVDQGDTFSHTFNNAGTFTYHDELDSGAGTITVVAPAGPAPVLAAPRMVGNRFLFDATGLSVGKTNLLYASTNLTDWVSVATNIATATSWTFTNTTTLAHRYFRLSELP